MRARVAVLCAVLLALVVACGAPRSGGFSEIDRSKIPASLSATTTTSTTTTTTTTTTIPETATTFEPVEETTTTTMFVPPTTTIPSRLVSLYFVAGRDGIVAVDTPLIGRDPSVAQVMTALESAPTGESASGVRTAIPQGEKPNAQNNGRGLVTIDVSSTFTESPGEEQRLAIAQMVLSFTHFPGVSQVTFTNDDQPISVILADGTQSTPGQVFYADDYADLLSTSAAPPTTTTTTTTTTSVPDTSGATDTSTVEQPTTLPPG